MTVNILKGIDIEHHKLRMDRKIVHEFKCDQRPSSFRKMGEGSYCSACSTVVIDFTEKTNEEILEIIAVNGGKVCGSMFAGQLEEEASFSGVRRKVALAGLAALLGLGPQCARAESGDTVKTEIVSSASGRTERIVSSDSVDCSPNQSVIDTPDKPAKKKKQVKRKTLFYIGYIRVYTMNVFPFIGARKQVSGLYARW